jgi:ribose/xylose/arabinose/galactoside ABC-type transport system permease subunit
LATKASTATQASPARSVNISRFRTLGLLGAIVLIALFFQYQNSAFLTPDNLLSLLRSMASLAMIAFAAQIVIVQGELDLSVGSVYLLAGTVLAVLWLGGGVLPFTLPFPVALLAAILIAVLAGLINGFFTTVVGIPSFIATLGMLSIAQGLALILSKANGFNPAYNVPLPSDASLAFFNFLGATRLPFGIPIQVLWLLLFFLLFKFLLSRTLFGFRSYAIGGNPEAAKVARLPIRKYRTIAFVLCAVMAATASILDFSYTGSIGPSAGLSLTFPVFAAVVIGGTSLLGGRGTTTGALLGALLLAMLQNGLAVLGVSAFVQLVFIGSVTILAVSLDRLSQGGVKMPWRRGSPEAERPVAGGTES